MAIENNKVVAFNYTLKDDEGNFLDSTENGAPFSYISGNNQILPKLEEQVNKMVIGSKKTVKIEAANGYGEYDEKSVQQVDKTNFPQDANLEAGMRYIANSPEGKQMPFTINKVEGSQVTIDFNHPLAGKNLEFDVELVDVREPSPEELEHGHVHGAGGHHH